MIRGGGGVSQKVTKSDRGEGGGSGLFSKAKVTSFLDSPLSFTRFTFKKIEVKLKFYTIVTSILRLLFLQIFLNYN